MLLDSEFSSFFQFLQWDDKLSEPESLDGQKQESTAEPETVAGETSHLFAIKTTGGQEKIVMRLLEARIKLDHKNEEDIEKAKEELPFYDSAKEYKENDQIKINQTSLPKEEAILNMNIAEKTLSRFCFFTAKREKKDHVKVEETKDEEDIEKAKEEPPISRLLPPPKMASDGKHFASDEFWEENFTEYPRTKNIHSVVLLSDFKGYVVIEAQDPSAMFAAIQGIRHVRGQLRGELTYDDIDKYLTKKSTVSELAVENTVEIIGGPFKGMKATITRLDQEKEEATVVLLDATYQLPVTVDANYLKLVPA